MIDIVSVIGDVVEVRPEGKLESGDFNRIAPKIDATIKECGKIKLVIDGRAFHGWTDMDAAEEHFQFIHNHHEKVEKVAAVAPYEWMQWMAAIANVFVTTDVRMFELDELEAAREWAAD